MERFLKNNFKKEVKTVLVAQQECLSCTFHGHMHLSVRLQKEVALLPRQHAQWKLG